MIDDDHAALLGGFKGGKGPTNDAYIVDLKRMVSYSRNVVHMLEHFAKYKMHRTNCMDTKFRDQKV